MGRTIEYWGNLSQPTAGELTAVVERAKRLEAEGWDGGTLTDTQCLRADVFVTLAACALTTTRLKLGTGTSNPVTRHPSVLASATAALHMLSNDRMMLGVGRGDSSLAHIGASPMSVSGFERCLAMLQAYLRGEPVDIEAAAKLVPGNSQGFDRLALGHAPEASRLTYLPNRHSKPQLEAACTGPKVIAAAARHADAISLSLGADLERLKWGLSVARDAIAAAGRDPSEVQFAAYLPLNPHPDIAVARKLAEGRVSVHTRFSIINKNIVTPTTEVQRENMERVASAYDMTQHGQVGSEQAKVLSAEFVDEFALVGEPERCVERILPILDLGFDRLHLWTASEETEAGALSHRLAAEKVLPNLPRSM